MKRVVALFMAIFVLVSFFSCQKGETRVFDYQDSLNSVSGIYSANGKEYEMTMYFNTAENGDRYCRRVEYEGPETVKGLSFTLEGENITAELGGVRIADSYFEADKVFAASCLFSLSEEDIYELKTKKGNIHAKGKNEKELWEVITDREGVPVRIFFETEDTDAEFKIEKIINKD